MKRKMSLGFTVLAMAVFAVFFSSCMSAIFSSLTAEERAEAWDLWNRGNSAFEARNWNQAITNFTAFLEFYPNHWEALNTRGKAYYNKGDFENAIADFNAARNNAPPFAISFILEVSNNLRNAERANASSPQIAGTTGTSSAQIMQANTAEPVLTQATSAENINVPNDENDFTFVRSADGRSVTITGYVGTRTAVNIPSQIRGLPVAVIAERAFSNKQLTGVIIPNSVTTIESGAFDNNRLTSVTIPNSVTSIGVYAFSDNQLTSVTIPNSVTTIEGGAFDNNRLTSVTIPNSVRTIEGWAFANNQLTSVTIPNTVTTIEGGAFDNNRLTRVTIPNSVTSIGEWAFSDNQLTSVTIGANVTLATGRDASFGDGFEQAYNNGGRRAGTYTRPNTGSTTWTRR